MENLSTKNVCLKQQSRPNSEHRETDIYQVHGDVTVGSFLFFCQQLHFSFGLQLAGPIEFRQLSQSEATS